MTAERSKVNYVGAPAIFALDAACVQVNDAFGSYGCFLVGSALKKPDWRDIDVRFIMKDDEFWKLFPDAHPNSWEFDDRWRLLTVSIAQHLSKVTGLPVDFQIQPQSHANERFPSDKDHPRHSLGWRFSKARSASCPD